MGQLWWWNAFENLKNWERSQGAAPPASHQPFYSPFPPTRQRSLAGSAPFLQTGNSKVIRLYLAWVGALATLIRMEATMRRSKFALAILALVAAACAISFAGHDALAMSKGTGAITKCSCSTGIGDCSGNSRVGCSKTASDPCTGTCSAERSVTGAVKHKPSGGTQGGY
jgi:hypothetical protein